MWVACAFGIEYLKCNKFKISALVMLNMFVLGIDLRSSIPKETTLLSRSSSQELSKKKKKKF